VEAETLFASRGLALGYGESPVLRDVDLAVRRGEYWGWIGPNGSGKSTLLRAFLGLLPPLAGELEVAPRLADRARIGYVPQRSDLSDALPTSVRELVELGLVRSAVPHAERGAALAWALARVGLAGLERRDLWSLSGGQRQRALLARALVRRPELLVLDEPTEGLDVTTQDALLETLGALHREARLTLIVVTHRLEIARERADHVALFAGGRVIAGARDAVLSGPEARAVFSGRGLALP
jgi:ABC-type Mn2+/Zn2+ transport system ATPase subunit